MRNSGPHRITTGNADPHTYLADVITRIFNGYPQARLDELPPWAYPTSLALRAVA